MKARNKFNIGDIYQRFFLRTTKHCNLKCPFCIMSEELSKEAITPIDFDAVNSSLEKRHDKFNNCINITGGEPMFKPKELFDAFDKIKWEYVDKLSILTNGTVYNEEVLDKIETYHSRASFGISPKINIDTWNWDVLEKLINRLGKRAVVSLIIKFDDFGKHLPAMKKLYKLGYRRFSLRWDQTNTQYVYPYIKEMEEIFKWIPDDFIFIASTGNCVSFSKNFNIDKTNFFSVNNINHDFWDFKNIEEYMKLQSDQKRYEFQRMNRIHREDSCAFLALKYNKVPYPAQHTDWWSEGVEI